jgi:hypothetical protein
MNTYSHTQSAGRWLAIPLGVATVLSLAAVLLRLPAMLGGVAILALAAWLFRSLTVEVTPQELRWHFGGGWLRRQVSRTRLARFAAVRTGWLDGWGIHVTRHGWLYNVAGWEAVALQLEDGTRYAVGTDDPQGLVAALGHPVR